MKTDLEDELYKYFTVILTGYVMLNNIGVPWFLLISHILGSPKGAVPVRSKGVVPYFQMYKVRGATTS